MVSLFPRDVFDEIWDLIESVSEGFPTYYYIPETWAYCPVFFLLYVFSAH